MSDIRTKDTNRLWALLAMALGSFAIGGSEFVSMGLLPDIAQGLLPELMEQDPEQGIARAGMIISAYALGVVVGAPLLSLISVKFSRRTMVIAMAGFLAVGTVLSASMPTFSLTVLARFIAGMPHGAFLGIATLLASSLLGPGSQGRGVAIVLSGISIANLIGVPLLTAAGQAFGWRAVYLMLTVLFIISAVALIRTLPPMPKPSARRMREELVSLRRVQLWLIIITASVGFGGVFAVFSYIADITTRVNGASAAAVPWVLAAGGLGMTLGMFLGGRLADWSLNRTLLVGFPVHIVTLIFLFFVVDTSLAALIIGFFLMNFTKCMLDPSMQTWLIRVAFRSEVLGASLNHAAFNIANALGAALGGAVIAAGFGFSSTIVVAIVLSSIGFALTAFTVLTLFSRRKRIS